MGWDSWGPGVRQFPIPPEHQREQFPLAMLDEQFVRGESPLLFWINASDLKGKGDRRISFVAKFVTSSLQAKWWRRGELNPRPKKPAMKRTTCVSGS